MSEVAENTEETAMEGAPVKKRVGNKKGTNSGGGYPPHVPTPELRHKVSLWAAVGTTQEVIASELKITVDTLVKYYREELDEASAKGVANVATTLYAKAMDGDVGSMIFYLKTRGRWSEKAPVGDKENPFVVITSEDPLDKALEMAKEAARARKPAE